MSPDPAPHSVAPGPAASSNRRDALTWILGTWGVGVMGAVLYPILRFLAPPDIPEAASLTVSAGRASDLKPNTGRLVPFGAEPAIVIRLANGELKAFTAVCTHLSCTVQYRPDLQQIWCACHGGTYDLSGRVVSGPPPAPLEKYVVNIRGDEVAISRRA